MENIDPRCPFLKNSQESILTLHLLRERAFEAPPPNGANSVVSKKRRRQNRYTPGDDVLTASTSCQYDEQPILSKTDMREMIQL